MCIWNAQSAALSSLYKCYNCVYENGFCNIMQNAHIGSIWMFKEFTRGQHDKVTFDLGCRMGTSYSILTPFVTIKKNPAMNENPVWWWRDDDVVVMVAILLHIRAWWSHTNFFLAFFSIIGFFGAMTRAYCQLKFFSGQLTSQFCSFCVHLYIGEYKCDLMLKRVRDDISAMCIWENARMSLFFNVVRTLIHYIAFMCFWRISGGSIWWCVAVAVQTG